MKKLENESDCASVYETHPWKWYVPKGAKTLIVGTFPPTKNNWAFDFFYPNKNNFFWKIIASISDVDLQFFSGEAAVAERKRLLDNLQLGITDMGQCITRKHGNSLDENLEPLAFMDIFSLLDAHPQINKIIFTSSSGPSSAASWFIKYLKSKDIVHRFPKGERPIVSHLDYKGKHIELVILYSPSPRAANRISFEKIVALYKNEIG